MSAPSPEITALIARLRRDCDGATRHDAVIAGCGDVLDALTALEAALASQAPAGEWRAGFTEPPPGSSRGLGVSRLPFDFYAPAKIDPEYVEAVAKAAHTHLDPHPVAHVTIAAILEAHERMRASQAPAGAQVTDRETLARALCSIGGGDPYDTLNENGKLQWLRDADAVLAHLASQEPKAEETAQPATSDDVLGWTEADSLNDEAILRGPFPLVNAAFRRAMMHGADAIHTLRVARKRETKNDG